MMHIASESVILSRQSGAKDRRRMLAVLIAAFCASGAGANEAADSASGLTAMTLEEVVVTEQKREQSLQDVPLAVSALTGEDLENAGIDNISDVTRQVPVLEMQSSVSPIMSNFRIRRVGNLGN